MNENTKLLYTGFFSKNNIIAHITQSGKSIKLEEIGAADQTIDLHTTYMFIEENDIHYIRDDYMVDWDEDYGKVLKRLDEIQNERKY